MISLGDRRCSFKTYRNCEIAERFGPPCYWRSLLLIVGRRVADRQGLGEGPASRIITFFARVNAVMTTDPSLVSVESDKAGRSKKCKTPMARTRLIDTTDLAS